MQETNAAVDPGSAEPVGVIAPVPAALVPAALVTEALVPEALSPRIALARGKASSSKAGPLSSLIWPALRRRISGRPWPSPTACRFAFKPPVGARRGTAP